MRGRPRDTSPELHRRICLFMDEGHQTAPKILALLKKNGFFGEPEISLRTVSSRMAECRRLDDSHPWSPFELDDENTLEDAKRILPVLRWLVGATWGQMWLSRAVAWWVSRICAIADPPPAWAWAFARSYQWASSRKQRDTHCLDLALMLRVWDMRGVSGSRDLHDAEKNLRAMRDNAHRLQSLKASCELASPTTWEEQWSDLMGFVEWARTFDPMPPWADDEDASAEARPT